MTDKKMTKAEIAAQMGVTPDQLAKSEAANKARLAATNTAPVAPAEVAPKATTEQPSRMDELKGMLKAGFNAAASVKTATVELVVELVADPGGKIRKLGVENTAAGEAVNRAHTSDSEQNRRTERLLKQADGPGM